MEQQPRSVQQRLYNWFQRTYGLDVRSLALLRIGLGLMILVDLCCRLPDINAFYTDYGTAPREYVIRTLSAPWSLSLHLMGGAWPFELTLFILAGIVAFALIVGYRTPWAMFLSWFMLTSLHNRNPEILQGGDFVLRLICLWCLFLPMGAVYSVDQALEGTGQEHSSRPVFSVGSAALLLQVAMIYGFAALLKSGPEWRNEGSAIYYALSIDSFRSVLSGVLLHFPLLLHWLTYLVLGWEALAPVLLLSPVWVGPVRTMTVGGLILLHLGFVLGLDLGTFAWIDIAVVLGLLPSWFWDRLLIPRVRRLHRPGAVVYYDCLQSEQALRLFKIFLILPHLVLRSAEPVHDTRQGWIAVDPVDNVHYEARQAWLYLLSLSPLFWPLTKVLLAGPVLCDFIERLGKGITLTFSRWPARLQPWRPVGYTDGLAFMLLIYVFVWNLGTVNPKWMVPESLNWVSRLACLDQHWGVFAPYPLKADGWYVMPGQLANGSVVDVFRQGAPVDWRKPERIAAMYGSERWRKYMVSMYLPPVNPEQLSNFGRYTCRHWNDHHDGAHQLQTFQIYLMPEITLPDYKIITPQKELFWTHNCLATPPKSAY